MPTLIITADDFGLTPSVTRGIVAAHAAGVVTATSVMVGLAGWSDACARLPDTALDLGLHLNLLVGRPLTPAPTLVDRTGAFLSLAKLTRRALAHLVDPGDVAAECAAQLSALRAAGARVTHIDSHRHTHLLPGAWSAVMGVAAREGVPYVRWPNFKLLALAVWRRPTPGTDHFAGLGLNGADGFERCVLDVLDHLQPGVTELMVHPGYDEAGLATVDPYTWQRERELAALTGPAVRGRLERGDITLTHFGRLGPPG